LPVGTPLSLRLTSRPFPLCAFLFRFNPSRARRFAFRTSAAASWRRRFKVAWSAPVVNATERTGLALCRVFRPHRSEATLVVTFPANGRRSQRTHPLCWPTREAKSLLRTAVWRQSGTTFRPSTPRANNATGARIIVSGGYTSFTSGEPSMFSPIRSSIKKRASRFGSRVHLGLVAREGVIMA
jgi:hypothetical protein